MKYISICSGIEAASVAWHSLGWEPLAFSEIEPFPCAVLAHHWPQVPNLGDMTKHENWTTDIRPDLIVGGTPCQAFSVAGLRKGLADPRGNLTLTFLAILARYRPQWVVWENVPGVLSENTGAFGAFLGGLGELGYGFAYRVLDAQYFGVAQRRKRVFVVGYLGDWRPAAAVLFERESLSGHPAPSREKREDASANAGAGFTASSFGQYEPGVGTLRSSGGDLGGGSETLAVAARMVAFGEYACDETASTIKQRDHKDATDLVVAFSGQMSNPQTDRNLSQTLQAKNPQAVCIAENTIGRQDHNGGNGKGFQDELSYTLNTVAAPALAFQPGNLCRKAGAAPSEKCFPTLGATTQGDQAPCVAFKFDALSSNSMKSSNPESGCNAVEVSHCLDTTTPEPSKNQGGIAIVQSMATHEVAGTMLSRQSSGGFSNSIDHAAAGYMAVTSAYAVRRLTPTECERLQGFPDGHTAIPYRGKPASDGPRYKACGNSMAVPVMRWIGERIEKINQMKS
jgi:DNA (cytosine-5)-methyltransferase 1